MSRMIEVLALFAEAHHLVDRHEDHHPHAGGLETYRRAWRERQAKMGLCRSCRRPATVGKRGCTRFCAVHRRERARWMRGAKRAAKANLAYRAGSRPE